MADPARALATPVATSDARAGGTTPPPAATQLVQHLAPLRTGPDGVHRMTVSLSPKELGPVQLRVEVRDGTLSLQVAGSNDLAREALRAAMPDLRK